MAIKDLISPGIGFAVASVEFIITRGLGQADTAPGPWRGPRSGDVWPIHVFIEDQYPGKKAGFGSLRTLIRRAWTWGAILEGVYGCEPVTWVGPSTWQAKMLRGAPGADTKERSIFVAERALGRKVQSDDEADAVNICTYARGLLGVS